MTATGGKTRLLSVPTILVDVSELTHPIVAICRSAAITLPSHPVHAFGVVKFFDGFGDADRNNDGLVADPLDTDTTTNGVGTWVPARGSNGTMATNTEVSAALDPSDVGLRWLSHSGFTGSNSGDRRRLSRLSTMRKERCWRRSQLQPQGGWE